MNGRNRSCRLEYSNMLRSPLDPILELIELGHEKLHRNVSRSHHHGQPEGVNREGNFGKGCTVDNKILITEREITPVISSAGLDRKTLMTTTGAVLIQETCRASMIPRIHKAKQRRKPSARRLLCRTQATIVLLLKVCRMIVEYK